MSTAITAALFHFLWQGAAIAFLLAAFCTATVAPRARYAAACAAMFAMPVVFLITLAASWPLAIPMDPAFFARFGRGRPQPVAITLWTTGVVLIYVYRFAGWVVVQRLRHRAVCAAPVEWRERLTELARRIECRIPVILLESSLATTPLAAGLWRPVILMPVGLLAGLPMQQVEAILLHELAHIARRDYLVNLLQAAVEGVLFYHPAVWWVSHVIRRERELCCDDRVVAATGDAVAYAQALAALEQHRLQLALATTGGPLMFRIHRLLGRRGSRFTTAAPAVGFLIVASAAALLAFPPAGKPRPAQVVLMPQAAAPAPQPAPVPQRQAAGAATPQAEPAPSAESPYRRWMNEEVIWIISNAERTAFNGLQTDQERRQFIEQFWLRRDPTPGTTENELKEEHYRRIAWANDRYTAEIPGWKTDRGMVYVKFGAPDEKEEHPVAGAVPYPYEKWRYRFLEGVGKDIVIEFVDPTQTNKYRMGQTLYERMGIAEPSGNMFDRMEQMIRLQNRQQPPTQ